MNSAAPVLCRKNSKAADEAHKQFISTEGDHVSFTNLYRAYSSVPAKQQRAWCKERFVSSRSLQKATDIYKQLQQQMEGLGTALSSSSDTALLRKALVAGLFSNAAKLAAEG